MSTFSLELQTSDQSNRIDDIESFVGEDKSGSFCIKARHERFMTNLVFGLAKYRQSRQDWVYLAFPGAVVYFNDNVLKISSRKYFQNTDYTLINKVLSDQLVEEEKLLRRLKGNLDNLEESMLLRLINIERHV
jgi:F-type H+-transporting ATPase subunit epsilon